MCAQSNALDALKFFRQVNGRVGQNNLFKRSLILIKVSYQLVLSVTAVVALVSVWYGML